MTPNRVFPLVFLFAACAPMPEDGDVVPTLAEGKLDVVDRVTDFGPLALDAAVSGEVAEDLELHGYTLDVRRGAIVTIEVTRRGSSRSLDSMLYVYGPRHGAAFGSAAIARDDDGGYGRLSRLKAMPFVEAGTYLVVLGTRDGVGRGRYRLEARCESGECAPPPAPTTCHPAIAAAIHRCIDGWLADPDRMALRDIVEGCADAEPVAPAWDALCATPDAPPAICHVSYEEFATTHVPVCREEIWRALGDEG